MRILLINLFTLITLNVNAQSIINLGKNINLPTVEEGHPVVSADGKEIYFWRDLFRKSANKNVQSLWYSSQTETGEWQNAKYMKEPFNIGTNTSAVFYISPDNNTILIRGYFKNGYRIEGRSGFSFINRGPNGFTYPVALEIDGYETMSKGNYEGGCLLPDGKGLLLYFSETSAATKEDLYYSKKNEDGTFSRPIYIEKLNSTQFSETTPFIAADNKTMYFASDRVGTIGSLDIWKTTRTDDTWLNWTEPENLGPNINSNLWEAYFYLDAKGNYAYMIKDGEVVKIELEKQQQPNPVVLIKGQVFDKNTNLPLGAKIQYEDLVTGKNEGIAISDSSTGKYQIALPYGKNYGFSATAKNYLSISENLDLTTVMEYKEINKNLYLVPIVVGQTIRINNIFFEFAKADLKTESFAELNRLVTYLKNNATIKIEMSGHTDNVGDDGANLKLSSARANAVQNYLVSNGIATERVFFKGYGETKPILTNDTEEGRALNRRVEFTILQL